MEQFVYGLQEDLVFEWFIQDALCPDGIQVFFVCWLESGAGDENGRSDVLCSDGLDGFLSGGGHVQAGDDKVHLVEMGFCERWCRI